MLHKFTNVVVALQKDFRVLIKFVKKWPLI